MHTAHHSTSSRSEDHASGLSRRALLRGAAATGLAAGLGGIRQAIPAAAAQEATPAAGAAPATHRFNVGEIEVVVLNEGTFPGPPGLFAVNAPEVELAEAMAAQGLAPSDQVTLSVQLLLVETGGQRVLLDTGMGPYGQAPSNLLNALASEGVRPDEIDVVLLTHMHSDHFGGALDENGAPAFPNARYLINPVEQEFWAAAPSLDELIAPEEFKTQFVQLAVDTLTALQGILEPVVPGDEIAPGLTAVDARGHTPGQLAVEITSGGEGLLHIVDAAHVPAFHLAHPGWFMVADNWPAWSVTTRTALLDRAADENILVSAAHFPFPGVGRVTKEEIGWSWTPEG